MTAERRGIPVDLTDDAPARWCGLADDAVVDGCDSCEDWCLVQCQGLAPEVW